MFGSRCSQIFANKTSLIVFVVYIVLFTTQGILIKSSQDGEQSTYDYNVITVILLTEVVKLIISIGLYCTKLSIGSLVTDLRKCFRLGVLYLIPAVLYCIYNNLSYMNLQNYDPPTYLILLQFRNVITGLCYQCLFRKTLSSLQWFSLFVLTIGCITKEMGSASLALQPDSLSLKNLLQMVLQIVSSCFAGVYNEYLLKDTRTTVSINIQNILMYSDSIIVNTLVFMFASDWSFQVDFTLLKQPLVVLIIVNGALAGITTSFLLKNLNSILKTFAVTIEIILLALISSILFATRIDTSTLVSIVLICIAMLCYAMAPLTRSDYRNNNKSEEVHVFIGKHSELHC